MNMKETDLHSLETSISEITEIAQGFGLDFYPMRYELCPAEVIYTFGAYGMPTRFSHWSFGKQFYKMKLQYDLGLSKIYELVINSDPCYAFLLNSNSLVQNKMIVAHVLAHCDFFKNNARFRHTRRDMVESMSQTAERINDYEEAHGREKVEQFISAVLSIQEHIDPYLLEQAHKRNDHDKTEKKKKSPSRENYEDLIGSNESVEAESNSDKDKNNSPLEEKDIMLYIQEHSTVLENWQRDIMTMLREEMLYFWPQLETKIMNEGWATYWHAKIMRELDLTTDEAIEFAKLHANVTQPSQKQLNPYYLGLKLFENIEREERENSKGINPDKDALQKLFEIRALDSDQSFIRNYMTQSFVEKEDLFLFHKKENEYVIQTKDWEAVRDQLVASRVNGGFPYLVVSEGDYLKNGELYLKHKFEETELDLSSLEKVMLHLHELWGRTVHLETIVETYPVLFSCDGQKVHRKRLH